MKKVLVLSIGVVKPESGVTAHGWSMYETGIGMVTLASGFLFYHANANDFEAGERVELIGNDTGRKLKTATVDDQAPANREAVLEMLLKNGYDYYPARAFKKKRFASKLTSSYSVKGFLSQSKKV
jgi:hypothetical protein